MTAVFCSGERALRELDRFMNIAALVISAFDSTDSTDSTGVCVYNCNKCCGRV